MELIAGSPNAEFGDKTSLIAQVTTRSGLGAKRVCGNLDATYGSFGTVGGSAIAAHALNLMFSKHCRCYEPVCEDSS